ncbi:DUF1415 domain-containing protein [Pseudothauera nasutitermitis]|uniref:DUF1415 domain-containing protein n=1 Tax=Pseudothauera nasutitermitis TaxID=2565930 RepID=A0A4S4AP93_9RHOO|nr:DUF1415 domain-containing protein [Pseudothauera nasutitermitis]THF61463.1 DUF1415 domain-containing protein [Pseudothauera nasutitermitis]
MDDLIDIEQQTRRWLEDVVIGLNLCPFAAEPNRHGRIRIAVTEAADEESLLAALQEELSLLDSLEESETETTLVAAPFVLDNFDDYNQFFDVIELWLREFGWEGTYQVAGFHPDYCFADTTPDDPGNLTNRSPWPLFHLIREASIDRAVASHPDVDGIPARNIARVSALGPEERRKLFPYLFG